MACRVKKKCRKCRQNRPPNMEAAPKRPPRGSLRKARRDAERVAKKARLTAEKAEQLPVELGSGKTICESIVSVVKLNVEPAA